MKLCLKNLAFTSATAAVLCFFSANAFAETCADPQGLAEFTDKAKLQQGCTGSPACGGNIDKITAAVKDYEKTVGTACAAIKQKVDGIKNLTQSGMGEMKQSYSDAKDKNDGIISANDKIRKEISDSMKSSISEAERKNNSKPTARSDPKWMSDQAEIDTVKNAQKNNSLGTSAFDRKKISTVSGDIKSSLHGPAVGAEVLRILEEDKKNREKLSAELQSAADHAKTANEKMGSTDSPAEESKGKKSGGLMDSLANPSTLLGLATAGAGLLAAMKKNSDVSTPTTDPNSLTPAAAAPITPIAPANLGGGNNKDGTTASQKLKLSTDSNAPNILPVASTFAGVAGGGGSGYTPVESGVSYKGGASASGSTSSTPLTASAGGGGLGGSSSSESGAHRETASAAIPQKTDDSMGGGFSGGGGGGLNFGNSNGSSSASATEAHAEDPLRDTLHDAIAAGDAPAADPSADTQAATGQFDDSEMLFTRVKSCIQRSVKKGLVISGLTAKIR